MDIELSNQAFHLAWEHFKLGMQPLILNVAPEGITAEEREEADKRGWDELRPLLKDSYAEDDLYAALLPLYRYDHAFDVVYRYAAGGEEHRVTGVVAAVRGNATRAVRVGNTIRLHELPADAMHRAALDVVPDFAPGPGKSVSVRSTMLDAAAAEAGASDRAMQDGLIRQGVRREDATALVEMVSGQRVAYAQFGACIMDKLGKRTRAPKVTNCFATAKGWFLMEDSRRNGEDWTMFAPVDKKGMADRVKDLTNTIPRN